VEDLEAGETIELSDRKILEDRPPPGVDPAGSSGRWLAGAPAPRRKYPSRPIYSRSSWTNRAPHWCAWLTKQPDLQRGAGATGGSRREHGGRVGVLVVSASTDDVLTLHRDLLPTPTPEPTLEPTVAPTVQAPTCQGPRATLHPLLDGTVWSSGNFKGRLR
jgi:hypothetical protein